MPTGLFIAGYLLLPLGFGLIPAFLPSRVPLAVRWGLWLALLVIAAAFTLTMKGAPEPFRLLALGGFACASILSLVVLVADSERARRHRRT